MKEAQLRLIKVQFERRRRRESRRRRRESRISLKFFGAVGKGTGRSFRTHINFPEFAQHCLVALARRHVLHGEVEVREQVSCVEGGPKSITEHKREN